MNYICYYRVSTKAQGRSGLGLGDKRSIVNQYFQDGDKLLLEFTEVESGKKGDRPKLQEAIRACQQWGGEIIDCKARPAQSECSLRDDATGFRR
ncbi:recombinase family protein [Spirosoma pollinicola]|uniref:recombinase family protein n=1 Tax=Spirosoma pollinicola TaxID=2057025 RepID=UPI0021CF9916|nr:recombinase family protein [Spirosoma pollinicola]